jgi:putative FmdB family regulatory protein
MPLYEYECQSCGNRFEEQQKLADKPLVTCPKCGKDELHKVISAAAFHLKGGGWYKDLYASQKPGSSSEGTVSPKPVTSETTKSEKSESKSESSTPAAAAPAAAPSTSSDKT